MGCHQLQPMGRPACREPEFEVAVANREADLNRSEWYLLAVGLGWVIVTWAVVFLFARFIQPSLVIPFKIAVNGALCCSQVSRSSRGLSGRLRPSYVSSEQYAWRQYCETDSSVPVLATEALFGPWLFRWPSFVLPVKWWLVRSMHTTRPNW